MVAKNIEDNIKKFLSKRNLKADRRLIVFLFFVALATLFWFLNQLEEEYVTEISLPVRYTNFPSDKILANELPNHFELRVRGYGYKLLEYKISNKFLPYTIDVNSLTLRMHAQSSYAKFFSLTSLLSQDIEDQISSELEIVSIRPDTLFFEFADRIFKKVPVVSDLSAVPAAQYMIRGKIQFSPDSIIVSGADPIIDTIDRVYTKTSELVDLSDDYQDEIQLKRISNVKFSEDEVKVNINIEKFTEASQIIPLNVINVPDTLVVRTFPKDITVTYHVALSDYEKVVPQLFEVVVDYNEGSNPENKLSISILNSPEYIRSLRFSPKKVEYIIERR